MAVRLGELLLNEKLITPEQLDEALENQAIFGTKLGSSLIELGVITDAQLCHFLSEKLGVPAASPRVMSSVPPRVIALVPAQLAGKHRVVPINIDGKKLALAMTDPTDFEAIDEVSFVTGCLIYPHIVPDVRITSALSKYYQIRGDIRYLRIEGELSSKQRAPLSTEAGIKTAKIDFPMMNESGELRTVEIPLEFEGFANLPDDIHATELHGGERYSIDQLSIEFASAKNRDQIATVFIKYLEQEFSGGALFIIRGNMAVGWRGTAAGKPIEELENLNILLSKPSVMRDVLETRQFSMGTLIQTPENMQILKTLRTLSTTPLLVLPIILLNKVVAAVVVSGEMEALGKRLLELQRVVYKASLAFEMLILKNKILMT
ncbi:MAG: hypothetical protein PHH28_01335 [Desulfuromonadaceae bacterium]|nr:hypothetical protein [Desulfuromonadaceae bacterium]